MIFSDPATAAHVHRAATGRIIIIFGCSRSRSIVCRSPARRPAVRSSARRASTLSLQQPWSASTSDHGVQFERCMRLCRYTSQPKCDIASSPMSLMGQNSAVRGRSRNVRSCPKVGLRVRRLENCMGDSEVCCGSDSAVRGHSRNVRLCPKIGLCRC